MDRIRQKQVVSLVVGTLLGMLFLMASFPKWTGNPEMQAQFVRWGYPAWFLTLIGIVELVGGLLLLIPRTSGLAAAGLSVIMVGAVLTKLRAGMLGMALVPLTCLVLCLGLAWTRRPLLGRKA